MLKSPAATPSFPGMRCARTISTPSTRRAACRWRCRTSPTASADYLERIDALVVTGGAFDVDPSYYGGGARHATVITKDRRTAFEFAVTRGALDADKPVLGICGGQQLLHVVLGGKLIQHIPDSIADGAGARAAQPARRARPHRQGGAGHAAAPHRRRRRAGGEQRPSPGGGRRAGRRGGQRHRARRRDRGHRGAALPLLHRRAVASRVPDLRGRREALPRLPGAAAAAR